MKKLYLFLASALCGNALLAQQAPLPPVSNVREIMRQDSLQRVEARSRAIRLGLPLLIVQPSGMAEFQGFTADGVPLYYFSENLGAAKTVSTDKVWNGGALGLDLSGDSMIIGEWDGGKARLTHQEFDGRAFQIDGASTLSDHATHVGVTMIGKGVQANAKGMAYKATLNAYDWNFDVAEMTQAAGNGLLISNHSYGNIGGWYNNTTENRWEWYGDTSISSQEDWKYGFYSQQARDWDLIAQNNPYYLIVKSAGNDRGKELPANVPTHWVWDSSLGDWVESSSARDAIGPNDCITGSGVSKNVLTVGAVNKITNGYSQTSDAVMSSFSGWGPTDDGRIKPDIVANGVSVYSGIATDDDDYATYNGTSMASPNASGSLLLIQEHHHNLKGNYLRAASLKGLVIHTADEAGANPGPDYTFGWGLLNTAKAVQHITNQDQSNQIIEASLANNGVYELTFYADGTRPLRATLSWTDVAGAVGAPALDPTTLKLVNDLDIRLIRLADNNSMTPWILDPANPGNAATNGDNFRDNVEQIFLATPAAGFYRIRITHKNTLSGANQTFSLLLSGESPGLQADFTLNKSNVCQNETFVPVLNILGTPTVYEWTVNGPISAVYTGASPSISMAVPGTYDIKLKISNPATADSMTKTSVLTVLALPSLALTPLTGRYCSNDNSSVTLMSVPTAVWSGPGTVATGSWIPQQAGVGTTYLKAAYTDGNGCITRDSFAVVVKAAPAVPMISWNSATGELSVNSQEDLQWFRNSQMINGATGQTYTPSLTGLYTVRATNTDSCETFSAAYDYIHTSLKEDKAKAGIFPNPAEAELHISLNGWNHAGYRLINHLGQTCMQGQMEEQLVLPLDRMANGVYWLELRSGNEILREKVVIQR